MWQNPTDYLDVDKDPSYCLILKLLGLLVNHLSDNQMWSCGKASVFNMTSVTSFRILSKQFEIYLFIFCRASLKKSVILVLFGSYLLALSRHCLSQTTPNSCSLKWIWNKLNRKGCLNFPESLIGEDNGNVNHKKNQRFSYL